MPAIEYQSLTQAAVLWTTSGYDSFGQARVTDVPCEIRIRLNEVQREALDPNGNSIALDATAVVSQDIAIGSILWLGKLSEWDSSDIKNLLQVKTFNKTLDVKGRVSARNVGLIRYKDTLPIQP